MTISWAWSSRPGPPGPRAVDGGTGIHVTGVKPRAKTSGTSRARKFYIAVDSEGPTGVNEYWARNLKADSPRLTGFRQLLTDDVNAAVEGCFSAGATEVYVKDDGFRVRNIIRKRLDPRARLIPSGGPVAARAR
ncbi:MAG: hypothetical protein Ct9H300mP1_16870 [Planctomycetaceae bacterium]|nr:MAG: hypothetical protein Ct9H300mP1_16870 [Planctomycetaceae bacterium]